jgi:methionine-rich copper-binding protein CopC
MHRLVGIGMGAGAALAVVLTAGLLARGPDSGRAAITEAVPADGTTLAIPPTEVDLAFTEPVDPDAFHVSVLDGSGNQLTLGSARLVAPDRLRQAITVTTPAEVTVTYHVTFSGGTDLLGTVRFGVGVAPAGAREPAAAATADPEAGAHGHGIDPLSAILLALDGIVVLGAGLLLLRRPAVTRRPVDDRGTGL